jgi:fatty acid-binding protein DegV
MPEPWVLVDAGCDVPHAILQTESVGLVPVCLMLGSGMRMDQHNPRETLDFYAELDALGPAIGHSEAPEVADIARLLDARLQTSGGPVIALHVSSTRSETLGRVLEAVADLAATSTLPGETARIKVFDSGSLFAGYGVQLIDLLDQRQRGLSWPELLRRVHRNIQHTHAFLVPARLDFVVANGPSKGDHSVSLGARVVSRLFNITPILYGHQGATRLVARRAGVGRARELLLAKVRRMIREERLVSSHVLVSYAGDLAEVDLIPGYQRLVTLAQQRGVAVHLAMMSMTNAINVGPRALSVGFLAHQDGGHNLQSQID